MATWLRPAMRVSPSERRRNTLDETGWASKFTSLTRMFRKARRERRPGSQSRLRSPEPTWQSNPAATQHAHLAALFERSVAPLAGPLDREHPVDGDLGCVRHGPLDVDDALVLIRCPGVAAVVTKDNFEAVVRQRST